MWISFFLVDAHSIFLCCRATRCHAIDILYHCCTAAGQISKSLLEFTISYYSRILSLHRTIKVEVEKQVFYSGLIENSIIRDYSRIVIEFFVDFQYFRLIASNYWFYSQIIVVKNSGPCATVLLLAVMSAKLCATVLAAALKPAVLIL